MSSSFSSFSISSLEYSRILDRFVFRGLPFDLSEQHLTSMFTISWKVRLSIFLWSKWRRSQSPKCLFKHVSWFPFSRNSPCNHKSSIFFLWSDFILILPSHDSWDVWSSGRLKTNAAPSKRRQEKSQGKYKETYSSALRAGRRRKLLWYQKERPRYIFSLRILRGRRQKASTVITVPDGPYL